MTCTRLSPLRRILHVQCVEEHDVGAGADNHVMHGATHKRRRVASCERHCLRKVFVCAHTMLARELQRDAHHVAIAIWAPEVADAIGAEPEGNASLKHPAPR